MSLTYVSGDEIGRSKKKSGHHSTKAERKAHRKQAFKRVTKVVKKVGVAPARAAFLVALELNGLKLANKMARTWNKPGGKQDITKMWTDLGGDPAKLKKAIIKGSKQQIAGDQVGALAEAIATATPIIIAVIKLFKKHKTEGSAQEKKELDDGVTQAKKDLAADTTVPTAEVSMPANKDVGIVADKNGNAVTDPNATKAPESKSGGVDNPPADTTTPDTNTPAGKTADHEMSSTFSPLGFFFMLLMYSMFFHASLPIVLTGIVQTICIVAMLLVPIALSGNNQVQRLVYFLLFKPFQYIAHGKFKK